MVKKDLNPTAWWESISRQELTSVDDVIRAFIHGECVVTDDEIEAFSRALAVRRLLLDKQAIVEASDDAFSILSQRERDYRTSDTAASWGHWLLSRGEALRSGFEKCGALLESNVAERDRSEIERYALTFEIMKSAYLRQRSNPDPQPECPPCARARL